MRDIPCLTPHTKLPTCVNMASILIVASYRADVCDIISLQTVVLPGGKTMDHLYGNRRKFASFLPTSPVWVIEDLQY